LTQEQQGASQGTVKDPSTTNEWWWQRLSGAGRAVVAGGSSGVRAMIVANE